MDPQMPHTVSTTWRFQVPIKILKALESSAVKENLLLLVIPVFSRSIDHASVFAYHLFPSHEKLGKCRGFFVLFFCLFSWVCLK